VFFPHCYLVLFPVLVEHDNLMTYLLTYCTGINCRALYLIILTLTSISSFDTGLTAVFCILWWKIFWFQTVSRPVCHVLRFAVWKGDCHYKLNLWIFPNPLICKHLSCGHWRKGRHQDFVALTFQLTYDFGYVMGIGQPLQSRVIKQWYNAVSLAVKVMSMNRLTDQQKLSRARDWKWMNGSNVDTFFFYKN